MMRSIALQVILDTRALLERCEPLDKELRLIGLTVKHVCEYAIGTWSSFDSQWVYYTTHESPLKTLIRNAEEDFFNNASYHRLSPLVKAHLYTVLIAILTEIYTMVDAIINQLCLSEYQTSTLVARQWVGKSLVMEINA